MVHSQLNTYTTQHKARQKGRDIFSFLLVCQVRGRMTSLEIFEDKAGSSEFILLALIYMLCMYTAHTRAASPPAPPPPHAGLDGKTENIF